MDLTLILMNFQPLSLVVTRTESISPLSLLLRAVLQSLLENLVPFSRGRGTVLPMTTSSPETLVPGATSPSSSSLL